MSPSAARVRGLRGEQAATGREHLRQVEAGEVAGEGAAQEHPLEDRLDERAQPQRVVGGDEVDGRAHERGPDRAAIDDGVGQLGRIEARQARPQADVRRQRGLGLQADEVLERRLDRHRPPLEQQLAGEQGTTEGARRQHAANPSAGAAPGRTSRTTRSWT